MDIITKYGDDIMSTADDVIRAGDVGTVWDNIIPTANYLPGTKIPATFTIKVGDITLWTNSNATKYMEEYITRFGDESWTIDIRSQAMLSSYNAAVEEAMDTWSPLPLGEQFGVVGGWELGIPALLNGRML